MASNFLFWFQLPEGPKSNEVLNPLTSSDHDPLHAQVTTARSSIHKSYVDDPSVTSHKQERFWHRHEAWWFEFAHRSIYLCCHSQWRQICQVSHSIFQSVLHQRHPTWRNAMISSEAPSLSQILIDSLYTLEESKIENQSIPIEAIPPALAWRKFDCHLNRYDLPLSCATICLDVSE